MKITDPRYGNKHPITLHLTRYASNGNIALQSIVHDPKGFSEPWCSYSVNTDVKLPDNMVAIKDWSENEGCIEILLREGVIEANENGEAFGLIPCGLAIAEIYKLTPRVIEEFKL